MSHAITAQGLDDYYRLRSHAPASAKDASRGDDFAIYDDPAVQSRFVRRLEDGALEADLVLEGIRCPACTWLIEQVAARREGVREAHVNYTTRRARVAWDPAMTGLAPILSAIAAVGYRAWPYEERRVAMVGQGERRTLLKRFAVAALGMMQVMMYAIPAYIANEGDVAPDAQALMRWAGLILTIPVLFYSAWPFFAGARRDIAAGRMGMDVPVALGLAVAFAASAWSTFAGSGAVYFDSVAMFVFLLTGGRYLELLARSRAAEGLTHLARLVPQLAHRVGDLGDEIVPATALRVGDRARVLAGDTLPADGVLEEGEALLNESLLTGESRPVERRRGQGLVGGAVNAGNTFVMRITRAGTATTLASIQRLMERALDERPAWAAAAERASLIFVAVILGIAVLAGLAWLDIDSDRALWIAVSVLIVTCPCALSLATPVALTVATGEAARRHVVVTRGHSLEALATATDVVFDKTGTLTLGQPRVLHVFALGNRPNGECIRLAAALARTSSHPLDRAIVKAAAGISFEAAREPRNVAGQGLEGLVDGKRLRIGRADFVAQLHGQEKPLAWLQDRHMVTWLGDVNGWIAAFHVADGLRPEAVEATTRLRALGLRLHLLTGDSAPAARAVARELGIESVEARATPERKREYLRELQRCGARVAMVGDGINDAPVLAQANVSIAMGGGADLAQVRADAVLTSDSLVDFAAVVALARRTRQVIRQNLAWGLAYNAVVIPLACLGLVTPLIAGIGMSASSLVVLGNALRLRR